MCVLIILDLMGDRQRLLDLNRGAEDQTNRLRMMNRVVNQSNDTTNNIMRELGDQRDKIQYQIGLNDQIKGQIKTADKKTAQMQRRNMCIKCSLYLVILVLFAAIIGSLIYKLTQ